MLAVISSPLQNDGEPERCTCRPFWNAAFIDLLKLFVQVLNAHPISTVTCGFLPPNLFAWMLIRYSQHTHCSRWYPTSACPLSLHPCNSTYCLKYVLIKFSVALRGEINNLRLKGLIAFVTSCLGGWCIGECSRCPRSLPFCRPGKPPTLPQVSPPGHLEPTSVSLLITRV